MSALVTRALRGMNTDLHLTLRIERDEPEERDAAEATLDACAEWLAALERTCSRFLPDSELCALNVSAGATFRASNDLFTVVSLALAAAQRTGGLFDPTILPALHAAGYIRSFDEIGHREIDATRADAARVGQSLDEEGHSPPSDPPPDPPVGIHEARVDDAVNSDEPPWRPGRWREIRLDADHRAITLPEGIALDLGGIAKGWAADEVARRFLAPFPAYLVDLGGDLRAHGGPAPGSPWIVGIADPRDAPRPSLPAPEGAGQRYVAGVPLSEGGIATSGDARRWWLRSGQRQHHLIDPRTGRSALPPDGTRLEGRVLAWTALAPTTAEADILAKVAYLLGYPDGLRKLARGAESAGLCVFANGQLEVTPNLEEYLHAHSASAS
jgi:thiamine biosynthesis lipoprotein